jgi:hypothetical protein
VKRTVIALILVISIFTQANPAVGSSWSADSLPIVTDATKFRALFGPLSLAFASEPTLDYSQNLVNNPEPYPQFNSILVPCSESNVKDSNYRACISSIQYRKVGSSTWSSGKLADTQLGASLTKKVKAYSVGPVDYDAALLRPQGGASSIWNLPDAKHEGGAQYLVRAQIGSPGADQISDVDRGLQRIINVKLLPISFKSNSKTITPEDYSLEDFTGDLEYKLTLQLGVFLKSLSGWYFGRLRAPEFNSNQLEGTLEISARPVSIPVGVTDLIDVAKAKEIIQNCPEREYCGSSYLLWGKYSLFDSEERIAPEILASFEKIGTGVKTISTTSVWGFQSNRLNEALDVGSTSSDCIQTVNGKGARVFLGVVSSNATMFQTTAPSWNEEDKSFSFKVASPHLDMNSKPNLGTYSLSIPQEQAACRWGSTALGGKAQIQILNADGTSRITTSSNQIRNGLLMFNVSGFGYSSPTIKISMAKAQTQSSSALKTSTITCVKGKLSKRVTAVSPKCPAGYKKT